MEKIKICLWASVQEKNIGVNGYGTEEENMFQLCDIVEILLNKYNLFEIHRNETFWTLNDNVNQELRVSPDITLEFHTNAGGGEGTEIFCNLKNDYALEMSQFLYNEIAPISSGKDRGIKDGMHLHDIRESRNSCVLTELFFHDNVKEVEEWKIMISHYATAIGRSVCQMYKIPFRNYLEQDNKTVKVELIELQSKLSDIIRRIK